MKNFLLIFAIICILSACKKDVEQLNTKECQISNVGLNNHIQATELQHLLDKSVAIGIPGITAVVHSESDGFFYGTSGYSDLSRMSVLKACNTFRVASLTKTFMGVAFMQLVESNQIDVNTNISTILDKNILEGLEKANETTIGELLSHTSGIANYDDNTRFVATVLNEPGKELSVDDRLDFAKQLRGTPDWVIEKYEQVYSNTNYVLLELILEEVSGKSYEEYITENILEPLDLAQTTFSTLTSFPDGLSSGYCDMFDNGRLREVNLFDARRWSGEASMISIGLKKVH